MVPFASRHAEPSRVPERSFLHHTGGGRVIASFLGTRHIDFTVPSLTGLGDRHFDRVRDLQYEVGNARIWGGIHYRSAVEDGVEIGTEVVDEVLDHNFHRSHD